MTGPAGLQQLQELFVRIISLSAGLAFVVVLIMLIVTALKYLVSGGEPKALSAANSSLTWTLLGIVFLILAWLVLKLIEAFTGVEVTKFCLGFKPYCP